MKPPAAMLSASSKHVFCFSFYDCSARPTSPPSQRETTRILSIGLLCYQAVKETQSGRFGQSLCNGQPFPSPSLTLEARAWTLEARSLVGCNMYSKQCRKTTPEPLETPPSMPNHLNFECFLSTEENLKTLSSLGVGAHRSQTCCFVACSTTVFRLVDPPLGYRLGSFPPEIHQVWEAQNLDC